MNGLFSLVDPPIRMKPPVPTPDETQPEFAIRFHEAMAETIPSTDDREAAADAAWRRHRGGDPLDHAAKQRFGREFKYVPHVPVFTEHTTSRTVTDPDTGEKREEPVAYSRDDLQLVLQRCNERIEDTGDFAPITDGHTPGADEDREQPPVLGYAGPFRLGMVGNKNPRWAIFEDEWHSPEHADRLRSLTRRSPEVWMEERMENRFLDPVAALGAETPRLDMGMVRYSRAADGRRVEKYTAFPSAGSVFVPGATEDGEKRKTKYTPDDSENAVQLNNADLSQVVEAILETEPMQWVLSQMEDGPQPQTKEPPMDPALDPNAGAPPLDPQAAAPVAEPASEPEPEEMMARYMAGEVGLEEMEQYRARRKQTPRKYECDDEDREMFARYMAGDVDEDEFDQYAAGKRSRYSAEEGTIADDATPSEGTIVDETKYSRREQQDKERYAKLEREKRELEKRVAKIEKDKTLAMRYSRLSELHSEGYALDLEKEKERAAKLDDAAFDDHVIVIRENYSRVPLADRVPSLYVPDADAEQGKPTERQAADAVKYAKEKGCSFSVALDHVRQSAADAVKVG